MTFSTDMLAVANELIDEFGQAATLIQRRKVSEADSDQPWRRRRIEDDPAQETAVTACLIPIGGVGTGVDLRAMVGSLVPGDYEQLLIAGDASEVEVEQDDICVIGSDRWTIRKVSRYTPQGTDIVFWCVVER